MAVRMVGHFRPPKLRGDVAKATPAPLSAAALAGDLLPEETNEVVALPPCFFCEINSASGRVRWPHFMNDGNPLRPSIYPNLQHLHATPSAPASACTASLNKAAGLLQSLWLGIKCATIYFHTPCSLTIRLAAKKKKKKALVESLLP